MGLEIASVASVASVAFVAFAEPCGRELGLRLCVLTIWIHLARCLTVRESSVLHWSAVQLVESAKWQVSFGQMVRCPHLSAKVLQWEGRAHPQTSCVVHVNDLAVLDLAVLDLAPHRLILALVMGSAHESEQR
jgi:hypothetical protein